MRPPTLLRSLAVRNLRGYETLDIELGPGPQLVWGPNAAGKTTLVEAIVLLALGRSHRTTTDLELIRWGASFLRIEGVMARPEGPTPASGMDTAVPAAAMTTTEGSAMDAASRPMTLGTTLEVALQAGGRKKIQVNGVPRRAAALSGHLRTVLFAPEEMLLVVGPPALRRAALDALAAPHDQSYAANAASFGRAVQQRNSLLRAIREGESTREQLRLWDEPFLAAGAAIVGARLHLLEMLAEPLAAAHREIAPTEERLTVGYSSNAAPLPGESPRDALARRLRETSEKEIWNGTTLVGPHRDDLVFSLGERDMATFSSRGQQRTAILALKLAELDLLTALDGRAPLLLLDDVFSELDPARRAHLAGRIAELPQALITATEPSDIDAELRHRARLWRVVPAGDDGARIVGCEA
ncbi:MAG: DNA replication/repair protein RecF [Candidatus Limnocylindrales bacterium]